MERAEFYSALYDSNNYLEHHGVDGQKWGKRNGPPYPLNSEGKASLKKQRKAEKLNTENKLAYEQYKYAGRANTAYNVKVAGRVAAPVGGVIGAGIGSTIGPEGTILGTLAGVAIADLGASATSGIINLGMNAVRNSKYKKDLLESQKRTNANLTDDLDRLMISKKYKPNLDSGGDFMRKTIDGVEINVHNIADADRNKIAKNVQKLEPKVGYINDQFTKELKDNGYGALVNNKRYMYISDTVCEIGTYHDGHDYSTYINEENGKIEKGIMMNG